MRRKIKKIKFLLYKLLINVVCKIITFNSNKRVAIVSCNKWKNKVLEDVKLKYYLSKVGIKTDIISFEEHNNIEKYEAVIIRSVWGFSRDSFQTWLDNVHKKNIKIFNNIELIKSNYSKKNQIELLSKYNIECIPTDYINNDVKLKQEICAKVEKYGNIVVKPHISESGKGAFVIPFSSKIKNSVSIEEFLNQKTDTDLFLVQPFYEEITDGEISVIVIDKKVSHIIKRFPGVFDTEKKTVEISLDIVDKKIIDIANKIANIKEYSDHLYIRIDFIKTEDRYLVLEIELVDPMLFFNAIEDKKKRKNDYYNFSNAIKERLSI